MKKSTALLLTLFLGWLGIHQFYLGNTLKGVLYLIFSWTGIPLIISIIDLIRLSLIKPDEFQDKFKPAQKKQEKHNYIKVVIIILIAVSLIIIGNSNLKKEKEELALKEAKEKQEKVDYFNNNKEHIIEIAQQALVEEEYQTVITQTSKYLAMGDSDINSIHAKANKKLLQIQRNQEIEQLVAELKTVPASELQKNKNLYQKLLKLDPNNQKYQQKLSHYSQKILEKHEKEQKQLMKFGLPPEPSAWDGSYTAIKEYLRTVANDPDSIKIYASTEVYTSEDGWLVGCDYGGKNAYGGMVRQSKWFVIVHNQVVQVHDISKYKIK